MEQELNILPGNGGKPFYIAFSEDWVKKNHILESSAGKKIKVLKWYKNTWWRRVLRKLGFRVRILQAKVVEYET